MGLFSSKYVHTVGTSISRVIDNATISSTIKNTTLASVFNGEDLVDSILEASLDSLATKHNRIYNYGKNTYLYGLPSGEIYTNNQGGPEIQAILNAEVSPSALLEYRRFGPANGIHMGWMKLIADYGYQSDTNILAAFNVPATQTTAYLADMVLELPAGWQTSEDSRIWSIFGIPANSGYLPSRQVNYGDLREIYFRPSPVMFNGGIAAPRLRVTYETHSTMPNRWSFGFNQETNPDGPIRKTVYVPLTLPTSDRDFFMAMYTINGKPHYWMYEKGLGTYPSLDDLYTDAPAVVGDFYPNIYFRLNKTNLGANKTSTAYRHGKKLVKLIGLDYDTVSDAVHSNPGIGDVQSAIMQFAVPADTTNQVELDYLYRFFDAVYAADNPTNNRPVSSRSFFSRLASARLEDNSSQAIVIADRAHKMVLNNDGIIKVRRVGVIGPVGFVTKVNGTHDYTEEIETSNDGFSSIFFSAPRSVRYRAYRKQISANQYDEIQVLNLVMRYFVAGSYQTTLGDEGGEICLVPVDRGILRGMSFGDRELLLSRSLHFIFNSYVIQKIKWYQSGFFANLIKIVGIVLTVISLGSDGGFFAAAGAALATSVQAFIILVATNVLIYFAVKTAFKLFVKVVGEEIGLLVAIFAAAYGGLKYLQNASTNMVLTAKDFLSLASNLASAVGEEITGMFDSLKDEMAAFDALKDERIKLLETGADLLKTTSIISPMIILGESPTDFYKRTVHSGNIGTLLLDDVRYFVDRSLTLPDFSSTVGAYAYDA